MVDVSINRLAANKPVAKDSSVLATCVIHAEVGQRGQHLGWSNEMELKVGAVKSREGENCKKGLSGEFKFDSIC